MFFSAFLWLIRRKIIYITFFDGLLEGVKFSIDFIEEFQVISHSVCHFLGFTIFFQVGQFVFGSHALMQVLDFNFLHMAILTLTSHLVFPLLFYLRLFTKRCLFIFLFLPLLDLVRRRIDATDRVDAEAD